MIRLMNGDDMDAVMGIEALCFCKGWNKSMFLYELEDNAFGSFFVCCEEDEIVGFIDFWITFETCQLANLAVHPAHQRKGYAKQMLEKMISYAEQAHCENIMLEVRVHNTQAYQLYTSYGFCKIRIRKGYYSDTGEDAIVMCKALGGTI